MDERDWVVEHLEAHRPHLRPVACPMLGSLAEADGAVQDSWLRFSRAGADGIEKLPRVAHDHRGTGVFERTASEEGAARGLLRRAFA